MIDVNSQVHLARPGLTLFGLALLGLTLLPSLGQAQSASDFDEVGRFYIQNFAPHEYGASSQNWSFAQDPRGLIYVGNSDGVLEYDGVSWRLIPTANRSIVRSLAVDSSGRVFVGANADFGYLAADSTGRAQYISLVEHLPQQNRDFSDVWGTFALEDGVYFQCREYLFRWRDGRVKVWRPETPFFLAHAVHGTFHVQTQSGDWLYLYEDALHLVSGGEGFVDQRIQSLVPHGEDAYLAVTAKHGIFRCHGKAPGEQSCISFSTDLTEMLDELDLYHASLLPGEILALGTERSGMILLDRDGRLIRVLGPDSGLDHETVWATFGDRQGGLWLGLNDGLARVELTPAMSYFDKTSGLVGIVSDVARHRGRLYVATAVGVFVLETTSRSPQGGMPRFVAVPGVKGQCWSLLSTSQGLLVGSVDGVYNLDEGQMVWPLPNRHVMAFHRSERDPTRLYLGLSDGLARLSLRAGEWRDAGRLESMNSEVRSFAEDDQGRLWIGTMTDGVFRFEPGAAFLDDALGQRFDEKDGLPTGWVNTKNVAGQVRFLSRSGAGLFHHAAQPGSTGFVGDTTFLRDKEDIDEVTTDERGRVWIVAGAASGVATPAEEGGYSVTPTALRRVPDLRTYDILAEPRGPLWVGGSHGLIRLDTESSLDAPDFPVWIRRITTADATLHEGPSPPPPDAAPRWPHLDDALRFAFAAPRYDMPERTSYRSRLSGFDDDWSAWSHESHKEYTNLWEGEYVFRVQARDVYGFVSREDTFAFHILPPWYRTWWAFTLYGLAFTALVLAYVRSHRQDLRREREAADRERKVSARLREVDQLKDDFLANTSHELRTPLYGITGLAESLIDGAAGELPETARAHLSLLAQSGHRLSMLVNDILDFSKLEHQSLELALVPVDLRALTDIVLTLATPLATDKGLVLVNGVDADLAPARADPNRVQQILHNLIGNAIKYTESGQVEVTARADGQQLKVSVRDSGIGIAADQLERIFEPFVQTDASLQRRGGGTGLGLAVSRQLVELHGGALSVESSPSQGSTFSFTLPVSTGNERVDGFEPAPAPTPPMTASNPVPVRKVPTDPASEAREILVVDDEPIVRQVLENHLAPVGYRVLLASSGAEALQLLEGHGVDLILLDIMMPKMSGFEVCRILRQKHPIEALPILFLSAMNRTSDRTTALSQGGNDYIAKPVAKAELLSRVATHLQLLEAHRLKEQEVLSLRGLLPICVHCKNIRDDEGFWNKIETYISTHSEAEFTHGLCPSCATELYPDLRIDEGTD